MKFPAASTLEFLLRRGDEASLAMVTATLDGMAAGGMYDVVGGGFHRYSVDERWLVPHFEKMLYDNALLAESYTAAYEETGLEFYKDTAVETIGYILREMRGEMGGFFSSEDADVAGQEGAYYLWTADEIRKALGKDAQAFIEFFSATEEGNYEGRNTLRIDRNAKGEDEPVPDNIKRMKARLFEERKKREAPQKDRKIIAAWNGLAISALSRAGRTFRRKDFGDEARRAARFLLSSLRDENGRIQRYFLDGKGEVKGMLEDYALLALGLLSLHENTGEDEWLQEGRRLVDKAIELFYDDTRELFYDIGSDQEQLFVRERDLYDNDVPSGSSAAAAVLLRLGRLLDNGEYIALSEGILKSIEGVMEEPVSYGNFLTVLESFLAGQEKRPH